MVSRFQLHVQRWAGGCGSELCAGATRVYCRGSLPCDVLFTGEAPGESENVLGRPFVGPAGQLLDMIVARALPTTVRKAFTNLVCCIPREDVRNDAGEVVSRGKAAEPTVEAIEACAPRLQELLDMAKPRLLVCVGNLARDWLMPGFRNPVSVSKDVKVIAITHPAAILKGNIAARGFTVQRCEVAVRSAWEDVCG